MGGLLYHPRSGIQRVQTPEGVQLFEESVSLLEGVDGGLEHELLAPLQLRDGPLDGGVVAKAVARPVMAETLQLGHLVLVILGRKKQTTKKSEKCFGKIKNFLKMNKYFSPLLCRPENWFLSLLVQNIKELRMSFVPENVLGTGSFDRGFVSSVRAGC